MPLSGGRRRHSRKHSRKHRGGADPEPVVAAPPVSEAKGAMEGAAKDLKNMEGAKMEGGRRKRSTAKKLANELKRVAKKAKKLTMRLKKMKAKKH
jgi:hypothetical protein